MFAAARKQLGSLRRRRIAFDRQVGLVDDAVGVEGLAAPIDRPAASPDALVKPRPAA